MNHHNSHHQQRHFRLPPPPPHNHNRQVQQTPNLYPQPPPLAALPPRPSFLPPPPPQQPPPQQPQLHRPLNPPLDPRNFNPTVRFDNLRRRDFQRHEDPRQFQRLPDFSFYRSDSSRIPTPDNWVPHSSNHRAIENGAPERLNHRPIEFVHQPPENRISQRSLNHPVDSGYEAHLHRRPIEFTDEPSENRVQHRLIHGPIVYDQELRHHAIDFDRDMNHGSVEFRHEPPENRAHQRLDERSIELGHEPVERLNRRSVELGHEPVERLNWRSIEFGHEPVESLNRGSIEFDNELHRNSIERPLLVNRTDRVRLDPEIGLRGRVQFDNEYEQAEHTTLREQIALSLRDEYHRQSNVSLDSGRSPWDSGSLLNQGSSSRDFDHESGNYDRDRVFRGFREDELSEKERWDHSRLRERELLHDSVVQMRNSEIDRAVGSRIYSRKHDYQYSDMRRYGSKGNRDHSKHDINHTPKKQLQKKSAFLRIQNAKPNHHRHRDDNRFQYPAYSNHNSKSPYKGKGYVEEKRPVSPVELDVSFKSNALIAKAISSVSSDTCSTPRSSKIRKVGESSTSYLSSSANNISEGCVKVDSFAQITNSAFRSEDTKCSEDNLGYIDVGSMHDSNPHPYSSKTEISRIKSEVVKPSNETIVDEVETIVSSSRTPKKNSAKRISRPHLSTLQPSNKQDESLVADSSTCRLDEPSGSPKCTNPVEEKITYSVNGSVKNVDLQPCAIEQALAPETTKMDGSAQAVTLKDCGMDVDSGVESVRNVEVVRNTFDSTIISSNGIETNVPKGSINVDTSSYCLGTDSNCDEDLANAPGDNVNPGTNDIADVTKQFIQNGDLSAPKNALENDSKTVLSLEGNKVSGLLSSENVNKHCCFVNNEMTTGSGLLTGSLSTQQNMTVSDSDTVGNVNNQPCSDHCSAQPNKSAAEANLVSVTTIPKSPTLLSSEETRIQNSSTPTNSYNHTNIRENFVPIGENGDDFHKQHSAGPPLVSLKTGSNSPDSTILKGSTDDNETKVRNFSTEVDDSGTSNLSSEPPIVVSPLQAVDTTWSLSVKNPGPSEAVVSDIENVSVDLQPSSVKLSGDEVSARTNLVAADGTSPVYEKRWKDSASDLRSSDTNSSEEGQGLMLEDTVISIAESLPSHDSDQTQTRIDTRLTCTDTVNTMCQLPYSEANILHEERSTEGVTAVKHTNAHDSLKPDHLCIDSCSFDGNLAMPDAVPPKEDDAPFVPVPGQSDPTYIETGQVEELNFGASDDKIMGQNEVAECTVSYEVKCQDLRQHSSSIDVEFESNLHGKHALPSVHLQDLPHVPGMQFDDRESTSTGQFPGGSGHGDDTEPFEKYVIDGGVIISVCTSPPQNTNNNKPEHAVENEEMASRKTMQSHSVDSNITTQSLNCVNPEQIQRSHALQKAFPGHLSLRTASSTHIGKARTWHRSDNSTLPSLPRSKPSISTPVQKKFSPDFGNMQGTSYVRKGNSLVRKPVPAAAPTKRPYGSSVYRLNTPVSHELKKGTSFGQASDHAVDVIDPVDIARRGVVNDPCERPKTPPFPSCVKDPTPLTSPDYIPSSLAEGSSNCCEIESDPVASIDTNNISKISENVLKISEASEDQINLVCNPGGHIGPIDRDSASSTIRRMVYVKRKSNQLVAASKTCDQSDQSLDKSQTLSSDSYYKRSKNQLIRTPSESQIKQSIVGSDDNLSSEGQKRDPKIPAERSGKKHTHKVLMRRNKLSKLSLVWTLCGSQSSKGDGISSYRPTVLPNLFPWKRPTYWRNFMRNPTFMSNNNSLSVISRKMLMRDAVYTRSLHGFSIRKSKVLSIGGSSLKWSKSMETHSKRANKEATLALAAAAKKRREKNGAARVSAGTKNRDRSRERIFRIGSFRYKMDPSKRTLQRIPDDESSDSTAQLEKTAKQSYVPRRLVIGSNEYVRIGNGNQLVRDPKKRLRILASEKVRWSLHNVRQRLAKKRKYCQFFTRFGKCNKDDGKCPYIHDPSKIAVCTKFLNGLCSNSNCKLTHKVIPERMPDCSYFLQGLCANKDCPYRHVNVNPNAPICEGFLRGYCADGDECQKKHSYVCPTFEAAGTCPQGSKCKLHHPKKRKGKKRKRSGVQDNCRGRYFGSMEVKIAEPGSVVLGKDIERKDDDSFFDGSLPDYIPLSVCNDETECKRGKQIKHSENETSDSLAEDLDEIIKPVLMMDTSLAK